MGSKATHIAQQEVRAVKTIAKHQKDSEGIRRRVVTNIEKQADRLKNEIDIMKRMDHPGIIRLYETFEDETNVCIVMELCTGGDLFDQIAHAKSFTERCAAKAMQQILRAVFYMHESGIVHRDLKPENILFLNKAPLDSNVIKIIDFGMSTRWSPGQVLTTKVGTPHYVAPQVLVGAYDNLCDLWSCGVILYILFVGYPPFGGKTHEQLVAKIRSGRVSFKHSAWRHVSTDAQHLVKLLLKLNPRHRFNAEQALNYSWIETEAPVTPRASLQPALLDNLKTFQSKKRLKKAVLQGRLSEERIKGLRETLCIIDELDRNGDGSVDSRSSCS